MIRGSYIYRNQISFPTHNGFCTRLFQRLDQFNLNQSPLFEVAESDIAEVSEIYYQLKAHDSSVVNIRRILLQMKDSESIRRGSPARFLAYFGVLESLLTHKPDPKDPYDSITRQVKKKLTLLEHQNRHQAKMPICN